MEPPTEPLTNQHTATVTQIYQRAFAGSPWFENLTMEEVTRRFHEQKAKIGFQGLVVKDLYYGKTIAGAAWWDTPTIEQLTAERGEQLVSFVQSLGPIQPGLWQETIRIVWEREIIIDPSWQHKGYGRALRWAFIRTAYNLYGDPTCILTRMRNDNDPIILIARAFGFKRTGIKIPSSQIPGLTHEYWYHCREDRDEKIRNLRGR